MRVLQSPAAGALAFILATGIPSAWATEGYFLEGYGAREKALAGAGVADSRDPLALSINPAGLVDLGHQYTGGLTAFSPDRGYGTTGPGFVAQGDVRSGRGLFPIPYAGYSRPIDATSAWGVAAYGNGGMNTTYSKNYTSQFFPIPFACPKPGVFCGENAGVDLNQAFLSAGYAQRFGNVSIGVAPILAIQIFKARGLSGFGPFSVDQANLSDHSYNWSVGAGVRAGAQWNVTSQLRIGVAAATPIWTTKFYKYSGLFAEGGGFDIPATVTAGLAFDLLPNVTLLADWRHIFYSQVASVGNSSQLPFRFGLSNGPGFGWSDVDAVKFGAEWRATPDWTFRIGYAHNNNPIQPRDVTINILAPGVVTDHLSGGLSYRVTPNATIDLAAIVSPRHSVSGIEVTPAGPNPLRTITIYLSEFEITGGWTYKFDAAYQIH
ncbi:OmpP1/FadL family transporter [Methylosinus sp. RM1]|uniref:OmpP1/FadL family transporter n=1 Tax=Methylosinus sp. RM1 TaxID=2583817 RepID=UPI00140E5651|nr:outer membrane protein transport protein [Methylosinus sp. RM1]